MSKSPDSPQGSALEVRTGQKEPIVIVMRDANDEAAIKLSEIFHAVKTGWWWIAGCAALLVGLAIVHVMFATRVYRGEVLVSVATDTSNVLGNGASNAFGAIASLTGIALGGEQGKRAEYIALLTSQAVLQQFIREKNLLPVLFQDRWDAQTSTWRGEEPSMDQAAELMRRKVLTVADDRRSGLVTVRVEWPDLALCAEWANSLVAFVNDRVRERTISEARSSIEFLDRELKVTEAIGVREASFRLIELNLNRIMLANTQREYALRVIDPASAPNRSRYVEPRPLIEGMGALLLGAMIGATIAWRRTRRRPES